jgi:hypothetical protein
MDQPLNRRQRILSRKSALWTERSSWVTHWREISDFQQPRAGRFVATDRNRGDKRTNNIIDNTAVFGARTLAAGLMSGVTSPARPWFRLEIEDKDMMEAGAVKTWLHDVSALMRRVFAASNTYRALHHLYEELGLFGTAASVVLPDFDNVIHHHPMTIGEYALATDQRGNVNTLIREFQMTVGQMVEQFGMDACSQTVRDLHTRGNYDAWVDVLHVIEPRRDRDVRKLDARNMRFASIYLEPGKDNSDKFLSESGFEQFPVLAPRWSVTGNDIYGSSPGMECLGDVKQLQHQQLRKSQAIDYQVNPPLQIPVAYKDQASKRIPGGAMFVDATTPGGGIRSAYEVNVRLDYLLNDIADVRERVRGSYYADLFLMLASQPANSRMTATEVAERHEEKLLMLGPVLERLHNELLSPFIDMTFERMVEASMLPPAPPELQGADMEIEFISTLAQAQRAVAAAGSDRLLGTVSNLAQLWPEVRHKVNAMQVVDSYGEMFGTDPKLLRSDEEAQAKADAEAQAAQAAQQGAAMAQTVESAKSASEVNPDGLRNVMDLVMGYNTPGVAA